MWYIILGFILIYLPACFFGIYLIFYFLDSRILGIFFSIVFCLFLLVIWLKIIIEFYLKNRFTKIIAMHKRNLSETFFGRIFLNEFGDFFWIIKVLIYFFCYICLGLIIFESIQVVKIIYKI